MSEHLKKAQAALEAAKKMQEPDQFGRATPANAVEVQLLMQAANTQAMVSIAESLAKLCGDADAVTKVKVAGGYV